MNRIEFVLILLFTFFVIVVWVTSEIILAKPSVPENEKLQTMLESVSTTFDSKTLQQINTLRPATPQTVIKPQPENTPAPSPSASGRPTPTPQPSVVLLIPNSTTPPATNSATLISDPNANTAGTSLTP